MRKSLPMDDLSVLLDYNPNLTNELLQILISYDIPIDSTNIFMPNHEQLDDLFQALFLLRKDTESVNLFENGTLFEFAVRNEMIS